MFVILRLVEEIKSSAFLKVNVPIKNNSMHATAKLIFLCHSILCLVIIISHYQLLVVLVVIIVYYYLLVVTISYYYLPLVVISYY